MIHTNLAVYRDNSSSRDFSYGELAIHLGVLRLHNTCVKVHLFHTITVALFKPPAVVDIG